MNVKPLTFALSVAIIVTMSSGIASASIANPGPDPRIQVTEPGLDRAVGAAEPVRMAAVTKKSKKRHHGSTTNTVQNNYSGSPTPDPNHPVQPYLHGVIRQ